MSHLGLGNNQLTNDTSNGPSPLTLRLYFDLRILIISLGSCAGMHKHQHTQQCIHKD